MANPSRLSVNVNSAALSAALANAPTGPTGSAPKAPPGAPVAGNLFFDPEGGRPMSSSNLLPGSSPGSSPVTTSGGRGDAPPSYDAHESANPGLHRSPTSNILAFAGFVAADDGDGYQLDTRWQNTSFFNTGGASGGASFIDVEGATSDSLAAGQDALREISAGPSGGKRVRRRKRTRAEQQRAAFGTMKKHTPYFIYTVTIINFFMLVFAMYLNGDTWGDRIEPLQCNPFIGPSQATLVALGAKVADLVKAGDWWRLFTPIFSHVGIVHLLLNLSFQVRVGRVLEEIYGTLRIGLIYMISGVGGNLISCIFVPNQVQVGASGALYGLLGVLLSDLIQNWSNLQTPFKNLMSLLFSLTISLGIGLLPVVDNFAHVGGFIPGIFSAIIFLPTVTFGKWQTGWKVLLVLIALPCLMAYFLIGLFVFYRSIPADGWCEWCQYVSCIPISNWCDFQSYDPENIAIPAICQ